MCSCVMLCLVCILRQLLTVEFIKSRKNKFYLKDVAYVFTMDLNGL